MRPQQVYDIATDTILMKDLDIYFGGSISGGREYVKNYSDFCEHLEQFGSILTEHVADPCLDSTGENLSEKEVYERDMRLLDGADVFIADVSTPSLGVGYEIRYAEERGIPVVVLYHEDSEYSLSGLIRGNNDIPVITYVEPEDVFYEIDSFIDKHFN